MSIKFTPSGSLDVATAATDLPQVADGRNVVSTALAKAKNIVVTKEGVMNTRQGSAKVNTSAINSINHLQIQAGTRYSFSGDTIYKTESSISEDVIDGGLADGQWSSIKYYMFADTAQQIYAVNGTDRKRIQDEDFFEWGMNAPYDIPVWFSGIKGGIGQRSALTGDYSAKVTFVRKLGSTIVYESSASVASKTVTLAAQSYSMIFDQANFTHFARNGITHMRVYRTLTGGSAYFYDGEIAMPANLEAYCYTFDWEADDEYVSGAGYKFTTTDSDNSRETTYAFEDDLGTDVLLFATIMFFWEPVIYDSDTLDVNLGASAPTNHARPPTGELVVGPNYSGLCFMIDGHNLHYSLAKQPEYWPATHFVEVSIPDFPGKALVFYNGQPYFLTQHKIFYIQGTGHGTFQPLDMEARTGAQGPQGAYTVDGTGIYHTGSDGLYLFNGTDKKVTQNTLDPIFQGVAAGGLPAASNLTTAWIIAYKNHLYFGYTSAGNTYPTNVLRMQLDQPARLTYFEYAFQIRTVSFDEANDRLLAGCHDGFIRVLESGTTDDSVAISWEVQSKDFTNPLRKHYPRWSKYDIVVPEGSTCVGDILLDDSSIQTHTVTGSRQTKRRLIAENNGNRVALNLSGSGPITVYTNEVE